MKSADRSYGNGRDALYVLALATIVFWPGISWSQTGGPCDFFVPSSPSAAISESTYEIWDYQQVDKGIQILLPLAEGGNSEAQYQLGMAYSQKKPPDDTQAFKWFLKSAEHGYRKAMGEVIFAYRSGVGVEKDDQKADYWLEKAGPQAALDIKWHLDQLQWYLDRAAAGNDAAQVAIANSYAGHGGFSRPQGDRDGRYGLPFDLAEAARWYSKAASNGNFEALRELGLMYETGRGVKKEQRKASALFLDGATRGDPWMQNNIADRYEQGLGIRKDFKQAFYWYRKAVDGGIIEAQYHLGLLYILGKGVQEDQERGWYWVKSAACLGVDAANNLLHDAESSERKRSAVVPSNAAETLAHDLQAYKACLIEHSDDTSKCDGLEKIYKADLEIMKLLLGSR